MAYLGTIDAVNNTITASTPLFPTDNTLYIELVVLSVGNLDLIRLDNINIILNDRLISEVSYLDVISISGNGQIEVNVRVNDILTSGLLVKLFHKKSNTFIKAIRSDNDGVVVFDKLDMGENGTIQYYAIAETDLDYNSIIYDKLSPY